MPRRVLQFGVRNWEGINLRDDAFQLRESQLIAAENVTLLPQGGAEIRPGYQRFGTGATDADTRFTNLWSFYPSTQVVGFQQRAAGNADRLKYTTGSAAAWSTTAAFDANRTVGVPHAATAQRITAGSAARLYIQRNAEWVPAYWTGTAVGVLADATGGYNNNFAAAAGGRMPIARYITAHLNYLFHGYIVEGANTFQHRIRWSHPGEPEDYRTNDYIDVSPQDGDSIVGLAPFGDNLYIFKKRSIWVLTGYSPETFELNEVVKGIGASNQLAIATGGMGLAFFDEMRGVFIFDGQNLRDIGEEVIKPLIDGVGLRYYTAMNKSVADKVTCCWLDDRLFVGVPTSTTVNTETYVWDPKIAKGGGWYHYTIPAATFLDFRPPNATQCHLANNSYTTHDERVHYLNPVTPAYNDVVHTDLVADGTSEYTSFVWTSWYSLGQPTQRKRWKRPSFIFDNDVDFDLQITAYKDYRTTNVAKSFTIFGDPPVAGSTTWGGSTWGGGTWSASNTDDQAIERGSGLGRAYSFSLKIAPTATNTYWAVNAINFVYVPPTRIR